MKLCVSQKNKKRMNYFFLVLISVLCLISLCACDKESINTMSSIEENTDVFFTYKAVQSIENMEQYDYRESDFRDCSSGFFFMERKEYEENGEDQWEYYIYYRDYNGEDTTSKEILSLKNVFFLDYQLDQKKKSIYLLSANQKEKAVIDVYGVDTGTKTLAIETDENAYENNAVNKLLVAREDCVVVYGDRYLALINNNGKKKGHIELSDAVFKSIVKTDDGNIWIALWDEENKCSCISELDIEKCKLGERIGLPEDIICLSSFGKNQVLICCDSFIYAWIGEEKKFRTLVDLKKSAITANHIALLKETGEGIGILSTVGQKKGELRLILMTEEPVENAESIGKEKKQIVLMDGFFDMKLELIEAFNESNEEYEIVIQEYTDDINVLLASENQPDIMWVSSDQVENLRKQGYLVDMTEMISKSKLVSEEQSRKEIWDGIKGENGIYYLPTTYAVTALLINGQEESETIGWNMEEYLEWFENHPDAISSSMGSSNDVLYVCLEGMIEEFVDFHEGTCQFEGNDFKEMIRRVKEITVKKDDRYWGSGEPLLIDTPAITTVYLSSPNSITGYDISLGEQLSIKGYPTKDGKAMTRMYLNGFSILSTSDVKEGAFAFIAYAYNYYPKECGSSYLFANSKNFDLSFQESNSLVAVSVDEQDFYASEKEKEKIRNAADHAEVIDSSVYEIYPIIYTELEPYFNNEKALDEVCSVIQNRVQTYLDERK